MIRPLSFLIAFILLSCVCSACRKEFRTLESGLQLRDTKTGSGEAARLGDLLVLHYTGSTEVEGERVEFFNSHEREEPVVLPLFPGRIIRGFELGLTGMQPGGRRELIVPPELGYGKKGAGIVIPPDATLTFDVELVAIRRIPDMFDRGDRSLERHPLGFRYVVLEKGSGEPPERGDYLKVRFSRFDAEGDLEESSAFYGGPYEFHLGQSEAPATWNAILSELRPGAKVQLQVPARLLGPREQFAQRKGDGSVTYDLEFLEIDRDHQEGAISVPGGHGHDH